MSRALAKKVLLIGWDAADWKIASPLLDSGLMPTLDGMINEGVMGNIATLQPILSPMLWNSIATGKRPYKHGIHGFMEPDPHSGGVRPVSSTSRKVKALWNILTQRGYKTHVLGWFAGHPAEPINGVSVSDLYPHSTANPGTFPPQQCIPRIFERRLRACGCTRRS
jgi:predicted AlkP superfamily phosphohydrolase/phosphomutase